MVDKLNRREIIIGGLATGLAAPLHAQTNTPGRSSKTKLGLVTYNVAKDWNLDSLLRICGAVGIDGVEFRTTHAHGVEPSLTAAQRKEVRQKCADSGLKQMSLGSVCEFHSPDPGVVKENIATCRKFIDLARDIGAIGVKVRPNGLPREVAVEKTLEQIGNALTECGTYGAEKGVEIWVEVHGGGTSVPANMRRIMDLCGHPSVRVTWNSNPTDLTNGSVREGFQLLRPYIRCCHINNLWGDYPYRDLFALLNEAGYEGYTLIECGFPIEPADGIPFLQCYKGFWKELNRS